MPGLLIHQLRRADDIAMAMKLRGYGKQFPRGVTYPTIFNAVHLIQIILISSIYWVIHTIATI
jgi:energy-coupling factor transporter transmembrane protein EcfT